MNASLAQHPQSRRRASKQPRSPGVRDRLLLLGAFVGVCAAHWPAASAAGAPGFAEATQGDPVAGREKAETERCQECHGATGNGNGQSSGVDGKFPGLAALYPNYILKEVRDFRSGERKDIAMAIVAAGVDDDDLRDIAAYFARQRREPDHAATNAPADTAAGRTLYLRGDASRDIAACSGCHGEDGNGSLERRSPVPKIGGQAWRYLDKQLRDWRSGERHNSFDGVMNQTTKALSDAEIQALADFLARR
jgi:cytochrome c553